MLRQLLTLLALISGLAATGAPAQTHVADVQNVRLVAAAELAAKCTTTVGTLALRPAPEMDGRAKSPCPKPRPPIVLPPVMLGVDRAHE
ncbi:hypothetical protein GRI75_12410 [Altererythrobacter soli]|uniref:Uncharacterized protein n=1 Tax=Croceibacterium soli TaxID=1739690 RepID=A0A6I4UXX6_9SPHN|nr:hypothetical protein [Croceibacterium soli]MXP42443.1 hypothetical protein [Croceibacterium soli]